MSWMDSWSRPGKSSAIPPPYYITVGGHVPYCHTCGRVMSSKKLQAKPGNTVKYCSERCRTRRPNPVDRKVERAIIALLDGQEGSGIEMTEAKTKHRKGDRRNVVTCDEIEQVVFGNVPNPLKTFGRKKNRYTRAIGDPNAEWKSVDMMSSAENTASEDHDTVSESEGELSTSDREVGGGAPLPDMVKTTKAKVRPPQTEAEMNFSAMGGERSKVEKIEESPADLEKRLEGQRRAEEREIVRRAARRVVVFGVEVHEDVAHDLDPIPEKGGKKARRKSEAKDTGERSTNEGPPRKKAEALMNGQVVEPSFAKGNWAIRWRE